MIAGVGQFYNLKGCSLSLSPHRVSDENFFSGVCITRASLPYIRCERDAKSCHTHNRHSCTRNILREPPQVISSGSAKRWKGHSGTYGKTSHPSQEKPGKGREKKTSSGFLCFFFCRTEKHTRGQRSHPIDDGGLSRRAGTRALTAPVEGRGRHLAVLHYLGAALKREDVRGGSAVLFSIIFLAFLRP